MQTVTMFIAKDKCDDTESIFAFQHITGESAKNYHKYSVVSAYTLGSIEATAAHLRRSIEKAGGCSWSEVSNNSLRRINDMTDAKVYGTFSLELNDVTITKPGFMGVGQLVYCGTTGKKTWRMISKIVIHSPWRYSLFFSDGFNISSGSECKYLVK